MPWKKIGRIFCPHENYEWMCSHAALPIAEHRSVDIYRIYFSSRNRENISSIGYLDIDLNAPCNVLNLSNKPVLRAETSQKFEKHGVTASSIIKNQYGTCMYYTGWNLEADTPWKNEHGLAIRMDDGNIFVKHRANPVLESGDIDPFSISYPYVLKLDEHYKMWYGTFLNWDKANATTNHSIRSAISQDGIYWEKNNKIEIHKNTAEIGISRPCVILSTEGFEMWYSYRGMEYMIGYARSEDGSNWTRMDDEVGISTSGRGWDSKAIAYPYVFEHKGSRFMLYNGNDYGRTGFGIAIFE